ncbi:prolyl oligopeptidase family serine peptidase [Lederbergia panacisoli]|uniref:prolyl oligopeptidase family serine peptidase n=1 Tax=Lederbergia panacisoli TaxID=1255251 RepID=UPI00214CFF4E|nr:prolyl oligopeptidase family serine peptidase [Lederbergia panacisoli]MCR2820999.1 prolyl oligopeptidase family serine peptidase [Lederbergia panacisoli]
MIEIRNEKANDIPLLHVVKSGNEEKMLPLIFFVHGFTSAKEHNLHYAYLLAESGFRVVLPEAKFHGERSAGHSDDEIMYHFWDIVINTVTELDLIKDYFVNRGIADPANIGLAGTSMGGIVTLGALTQYEWIKAAVSLMGSPHYEAFARAQIDHLQKVNPSLSFSNKELEEMYASLQKFDLSNQPEKLRDRPLMFWHGKKDPVVPFGPTYTFYEKIKKEYEHNPSYLKFIVDEEADHKVSREGLLETVAWFEKYLLEK